MLGFKELVIYLKAVLNKFQDYFPDRFCGQFRSIYAAMQLRVDH